MKVRVSLEVRCSTTFEVPELTSEEFDRFMEGTLSEERADAISDMIDAALPPIALGWDKWDVDEEEYEAVDG